MKTITLSVLVFLGILPQVAAFNCNNFQDNQKNLCLNINSLQVSDTEKQALMQSNLYGGISNDSEELPYPAVDKNNEKLMDFYNNHINTASKLGILALIHYIGFSYAKYSAKKWTTAAY